MKLFETPLFQRLVERTPFSGAELAVLIATAPVRYKEHSIEKRHGRGTRLISQPTKELKYLQRHILAEELNSLPISDAVKGYRRGYSILDHARPHAANRYLLKLDFKDFFPSLRGPAIDYWLSANTSFLDLERKILINILCREPRSGGGLRLSIGAPSSPTLSNCLLWDFDESLIDYCAQRGVVYTRYADDLAFSTSVPHLLDHVYSEVSRTLTKHSYLGLKLNEEKTTNVSTKFRRTLVGLTLGNNGIVSVGRDAKRRLSAAAHALSLGKLSLPEALKLQGQLAFLLAVDEAFVRKLCSKYGFSSVALLPMPSVESSDDEEL